MSADIINLGELKISVDRKAIKNIHLSVYPPDGRVHISAPERFELDELRVYAVTRIGWISKQRKQIMSQAREAPWEYISRESHYFRGVRYLLKVIEQDASPHVEVKHRELRLFIRPDSSPEKRAEILEEFYRNHLRTAIPKHIAHYAPLLGVRSPEFGIRKMKTKWGSCSIEARRIWLNLELARKPPVCLEYLVVHEMVHLLERNHNARFVGLMDHFLPAWRSHRDLLNALPVAHVGWGY